MTTPGPYAEIGKLVKQARKRLGMTRRKLGWWIRQQPALGVTAVGAAFMVRELEDQGEVMNIAVLYRILEVLDIDEADVADLLAQAKAASAAVFTEDLRRAAKVIAKDQGRSEGEVQTGLAKLAENMNRRPMA